MRLVCTELGMNRSDDQTRVKFCNIAAQNRFQPRFRHRPIQSVSFVRLNSIPALCEIGIQRIPFSFGVRSKPFSLRAVDAKPDIFTFHDGAYARERKAIEAKCFAVSCPDAVNCM